MAILLFGSLSVSGFVLDQSYRTSAERAARDQINAHFNTLLAELNCCDGGLTMPDLLRIPELNTPDSGMYAKILDDFAEPVWQSVSSSSVEYAFDKLTMRLPPRGERSVVRVDSGFEEPVLLGTFTVGLGSGETKQDYTLVIASSILPLEQNIAEYRQNLWWLLSSCAVFLAVLQGVVLHWAVSPLSKVVADIYAIQDGKAELLPDNYPREIQHLASTMNELLEHEKRQRERHRNSLGDLAHSMKTPLAVLRSFAEGSAQQDPTDLINEVQRLDDMVSYQLQRAVISGRKTIASPVRVDEILHKLKSTLDKVYFDKGVDCTVSVPEEDCFYGEKNDIFEILGNLFENAYKYTHTMVKVYSITDDVHRSKNLLAIVIEDDGPGVPDEKKESILKRGSRLDTKEPGQGIGLAMVADVVDSYGGTITVEDTSHGGARFIVIV